MMANVQQMLEMIQTGTADLITQVELQELFSNAEKSGKPLRVKLGIDPSAPHLTLGHSVPLRKMRQFQDLGHTGVLVVGDFTRRIGDPSGRSSSRRLMSEDEIDQNMETYTEQAFKILNPDQTEIRYNSEWLGKMDFADVITLTSKYTVARMLERDDFANRFAANQPVSVLEFLYPLAQAYDSVAIEADIELGGNDQRFNLLIARDIQREYGQQPQVAITVPLLIGPDGQKSMSQTIGNYIGISEEPAEIFGKIMSIPDTLIDDYFLYLTDIDRDEVSGIPPRDAKRRLAKEIVGIYHGDSAADMAIEEFDQVHIYHERPNNIPEAIIDRSLVKEDGTVWVIDLLEASGLVESRGQAKRLIKQGGVQIDDERVNTWDLDLEFSPPVVVQVGKRSFVKVV